MFIYFPLYEIRFKETESLKQWLHSKYRILCAYSLRDYIVFVLRPCNIEIDPCFLLKIRIKIFASIVSIASV